MSQNRFAATDNQYLERLMQRIVPVVSILVSIFIIISIRGVVASANNELNEEQIGGVIRIAEAIDNDIESFQQDAQTLVNDSLLADFIQGDDERGFVATQQACDIIVANPNEYRAVRYYARDGQLQLEAVNESGLCQRTAPSNLEGVDTSATVDTTAFSRALNETGELTPVLGEFRLLPDTNPPQVVFDIFTPVYISSSEVVTGVIQMEVSARNLLDIIDLSVTDNAFVEAQEGRHAILLDGQGRIVADSDPAGDNYLRNLEAVGGNITGNELYESIGNVADTIGSELRGVIFNNSETLLYSGQRLSTEIVRGLNWRVIITDNPIQYFAPVLLIILSVAVSGTVITVIGIYALRRLINPVLIPIQEADSVLQATIIRQDRPSLTRRVEATDREIVSSARKLSSRLRQLDEELESEIQRRNRDLQVAGRIGREAATQSDLTTLVNRAINLICNELGFYHAQVFLMDTSKTNAVLRYSRGDAGRQLIERGHQLAVGSDTIIGTVTSQQRPVIINDTSANSEGLSHGFNPLLPDTRAEMGLPLVIGDEVIGALDLQSRQPNVFSLEDAPTYQLVADQLAIAIYNAQLREQSQKRFEQIDRLNRQLTRNAWLEAENTLEMKDEYGNKNAEKKISAPISIRGEVIGYLDADLPDGEFSDGDKQILQSVAERVALAIENARLFQETQISLSETSTLYQLSRQLNEANTLEDVLQAIIVTVAPDASGGQVWLFDETSISSNPDSVTLTIDLAIVAREDDNLMEGMTIRMSEQPFLQRLSGDEIAIINDTARVSTNNAEFIQILAALNARAIIFIPLNMRGSWKGFMSINFASPRQFSERERRVYNALIGQAGVAVDNRLLLRQTETALERQEKLYAASRIINTAQSFGDLIYAAVATSDTPNFNYWLSLLEGERDDEGFGTLAQVMAKSEGRDVFEVNETHQLYVTSNSPMRSRNAEIIRDTTPDEKTSSRPVQWLRSVNQGFMAIFPLFSDNTAIALFYIVSKDAQTELSEQDFEVYRALTGQMSTQIQNRRLLEQTNTLLSETRRLYVATRSISSAQETRDIYQAVSTHLRMPFVQESSTDVRLSITILLAQPQANINAPQLRYEYQWFSNPQEIPALPEGTVISQEDAPFGSMTQELTDNALAYRSLDDVPDEFPMVREILAQNDATSAVVAPLWSRQQWFGVIIVRSDNPDAIDKAFTRYMQSIADQVAIAVENQRLIEETEYERTRLNTILETLPTGVLLLDVDTLEPIQHNDRLVELLGQPLKMNEPFTTEAYNIHRTGTHLHYPTEELAIYQARELDRLILSDDVAILHDIGQTDLQISAAPIYDAQGHRTAIVAAFSDISTLRSMENTMQENLRETVLLYETQRLLTSSNTLDELFDNIIMQLAMQQPSDAFIVVEPQPGSPLELARSLVQPLSNVEALRPILTDKVLNINDVQRATDLDERTRNVLSEVGARSALVLPMRSRSRPTPLGWLVTIDHEPEAITNDQERTMTSVSDMASTSVDNMFLVESTQGALKETGSLYTATTSISRAGDIFELFEVMEVALNTLNPDMVAAALVERDELVTYIKHGFDSAEESGLNFEKLMTAPSPRRDGLYIGDITRSTLGDIELEVLKAGSIKSFAAIALRVKEGFGGRIFIGFENERQFDESITRFLNAIADSASVVIDNQMLLEKIQNTLQETTVLYQASKALLEASEPADVLDVIVNHVILPHINQVFIVLLNTPTWDVANATVEVMASWQQDSDVDLLGVTLSPEQFPAWRQLATDQSVLAINDIFDPQYGLDMLEQTSIESLDTRSLVVIPLRVPGRSLGAIWLGSRQPYSYQDADIRVFQTFAEQTSLSLEASRLLQQTEDRATQLETSAVISQSVSQILDLDVLLPQVVDLIKDQFDYDQVQIFLMDEDDDWALLEASTGEAGEKLLAINHRLQKGSKSVIGQVTSLGQPSIALDTADANVIHQPNPLLPLTRSELALPLTIKGRVVGALDVQSNHPNAFDNEDLQSLSTLAAQIGVAIENARLYEETQRRASDMGFLFNVTTAAAGAETLEEALTVVAFELRDATGAESSVIYLPQQYEDYQGNRQTMLEAEAFSAFNEDDIRVSDIAPIALDNEENLIAVVSNSMMPKIITNISREEHYREIMPDTRSAIIVPVSSVGETIGVFVLESTRANYFNPDIQQLLQTLAGSLAAVIQNTLLLDRLRETNEQLREVDRLKSQFLASMSHELRTPLNSIIGFSRVMLKGIDGPLTDMQEQDLNTIYNSGNHLLNLINDILDQAKIEANELNLKFGYFDIKPMVESVRSIAIGLLKEKPLSFDVEISPNLPQAYGDEFRSRQIVLNIVTNAIKFTKQGGVTIHAYAVEDQENNVYIRIDVEDTGIGIAKEDFPTLFEQFRQIDSSLTRTVEGTGLGLPISKSLAEMQGGELSVESEINAGSTFSIFIPTFEGAEEMLEQQRESARQQKPDVARDTQQTKIMRRDETSITSSGLIKKEDVERAKKMAEAAKNNGGSEDDGILETEKPTRTPRKISSQMTQKVAALNEQRLALLIEDNKDMVDQYRRTLQREGFDVQTAEHPAYAEAMVGQLRPNLVLLDVDFGNGAGWNILESLKERDDTFDIPIIISTMSDESERAYSLGAHMYLQRPFTPTELMDAVLAAEKESRRERILIIDDQQEAIRLLTQLLDEHGEFRIFSATTGDEGISLVARRHPDLIILDLRMPGKDGFAVLDELRDNPETAKIPILVVTGEIDLSNSEQDALQNITVLHKSDISQEEYDKFIDNVRSYLESNNGTGK